MDWFRLIARDLSGLSLIAILLSLTIFLPPDKSLDEVLKQGAIRVCLPRVYPPLVTDDPTRPGIDVELLQEIADRLDLTLLFTTSEVIGRDFNPRNWGITRANCQIIAGGVVDSNLTRSFIDTGPAYATTGWAIIAPIPVNDLEGATVGALTIISGLDRLALSRYLRDNNVSVQIFRNTTQVIDALNKNDVDAVITESLMARHIAVANGWATTSLPPELSHHNVVFGLWKGDLTLKRRISEIFQELEQDGTLTKILEKYGVIEL